MSGTEGFEVRPVEGDHELDQASRVMGTALLRPGPPTPIEVSVRSTSFEPGRNWAAFAGKRMIGFSGMITFDTTVPGGRRVPTGGLTRVSVWPTDTRRGVLTALLRAQLADVAARGELLSSLRASEATIYPRFGYGLAGQFADHEIATAKSTYAVPLDAAGTVQILEADEMLAILPSIYDAHGRASVGSLSRPGWMWRRRLDDVLDATRQRPRWIAVHRGPDGRADGYVDYTVDRRTETVKGAFDTHVATISDLVAGTPRAYAALWRHVLDRDLVGTVRAESRPVDEPLRQRLANARALRTVHVMDEQWVRLVDVGAALSARSYPDADPVTIAVDDPFLPSNTGTWRIGPGGCERTDGDADLACPVDALGAAYLGGTSVADLAWAGRVEERRSGAVARADRLLAVHPRPWSGTWF